MAIDLSTLSNLLPLAIFFIAMPLALLFSYRGYRRQKERMKEIAARLGLEYSETNPLKAARGGPGLDQMYRRGRPTGGGFDFQGFVFRAVRALMPWRVSGRFNGLSTAIWTENRNKQTFLVVQQTFDRPLELGLSIAAPNPLARLGKSLMGRSPLTTGNQELDAKTHISGRDEMKVKYLVKKPELQQALLALYREYPTVKIDDRGITYRRNKLMKEHAEFQRLLDSMSRAAKEFSD